MTRKRKLGFAAALTVAAMLASAPANAQKRGAPEAKEPDKAAMEELRRRDQIEKEYDTAIKTRGSAATPVANDPWRTVRPTEPEKKKR